MPAENLNPVSLHKHITFLSSLLNPLPHPPSSPFLSLQAGPHTSFRLSHQREKKSIPCNLLFHLSPFTSPPLTNQTNQRKSNHHAFQRSHPLWHHNPKPQQHPRPAPRQPAPTAKAHAPLDAYPSDSSTCTRRSNPTGSALSATRLA